jgi:ABC-type multidrug transport system fused ATPase/permease subunit
MAVVLQENLVMDATIRENIAFGRPDASDDEIHDAARRAGADAFIAGLPDGYETQVGSKGSRLSGGQRQRIAIARALVRDAPIVILDEPTNHLDSDGSETLIDAMRELARGRTTLVITHDPAMIAEADEVVVFDRGHIVTPGTTAPESALTVEAL